MKTVFLSKKQRKARKRMGSLELTGAITAIAGAISSGLSVDEITLLAAIFVQLGDTLATIAVARGLCQD
jgi:dolichol kinase